MLDLTGLGIPLQPALRPVDTGYGHSSAQVADFGMYDGEYLRGYHRDVHGQSMEILGTLRETDLGVVVDRRWDPPVTAAVRLVSILGETTSHLGQAEFLRGIYREDIEHARCTLNAETVPAPPETGGRHRHRTWCERGEGWLYSTVTDLARLRGWSTSKPLAEASSQAKICSGTVASSGISSVGVSGT